jgi:hypothetical protein
MRGPSDEVTAVTSEPFLFGDVSETVLPTGRWDSLVTATGRLRCHTPAILSVC